MRASLLLAMLLGPTLSGCARFPEVEAATGKRALDADYPTLLPLELLLDGAPPAPDANPAAAVTARANALRARAARLRQAEL